MNVKDFGELITFKFNYLICIQSINIYLLVVFLYQHSAITIKKYFGRYFRGSGYISIHLGVTAFSQAKSTGNI